MFTMLMRYHQDRGEMQHLAMHFTTNLDDSTVKKDDHTFDPNAIMRVSDFELGGACGQPCVVEVKLNPFHLLQCFKRAIWRKHPLAKAFMRDISAALFIITDEKRLLLQGIIVESLRRG